MAYTIAVVQNTQTLQFEQMQVALQTAQNHASIEMPLKAEHLMTTHFNLAILTDNTASHTVGMPRQLKPVLLNPAPQLLYRRRRPYVSIPIQIHVQLLVTGPQSQQVRYSRLAEENPDRLQESQWATNLIILGTFLMLMSKIAHADTT